MKRLIYLGVFALLAIVAMVLTLRAQHTVALIVPTHDIRVGSQLQRSDLEVRQFHGDSVPSGALSSADQANGRYVDWPLTQGEPVLGRSLRTRRSGGSLSAGYDLPAGYRAIAVPVQPAGAVGGVLSGGDHVDVYGTPDNARTQPVETRSQPAPDVAAKVVGRDVLVLQLRSDQGQALNDTTAGANVHGLNFGSGKLGSVILAVPADQAEQYAAAAASMTIYLALSVG